MAGVSMCIGEGMSHTAGGGLQAHSVGSNQPGNTVQECACVRVGQKKSYSPIRRAAGDVSASS